MNILKRLSSFFTNKKRKHTPEETDRLLDQLEKKAAERKYYTPERIAAMLVTANMLEDLAESTEIGDETRKDLLKQVAYLRSKVLEVS